MVVKKITAENFKSFKKMTIEPKEKLMVITGKNGKGKTTITELFRYAITGAAPENPVTYGENKMNVSVELGSGTNFTRSIHDGVSKISIFGKPSTIKNLTEVLQTETGTDLSTMKIASSAEIVGNMKPDELGQLLLQYIKETIDLDTVISYIPNITPDIINELSQILPQMPEKFGINAINEAYDAFVEIRKNAKRERDACRAKANSFVGEIPNRTLAEVEKAHEELVKQEGMAAGAIALEKAYKQALELQAKHEAGIKDLKEKINANTSKKPNPAVLNDILDKKKICEKDVLEAEKLLQTLVNTVETLKKTIEDLNKPVCPISNKLTCTTDRTGVKNELEEALKENLEGIEYQKKEIEKLQQILAELSQKEVEYQNNASEYEKRVQLIKQLSEEQKNTITVPAKPAPIQSIDYGLAKHELKREMDRIRLYQECENEKAKLDIFEKRVKMYDAIIQALAPKGVVMEGIIKHYISIFENVCNDRAAMLKPDFKIRFIYDNGVKILCQPKAGSAFLTYKDLSEGEKAIVLFLLLDMLNALSGLNVLILDGLEKLDSDVFKNLIALLSEPAVLNEYDHIIICAVDHDDTMELLSKLNNVEWIKL